MVEHSNQLIGILRGASENTIDFTVPVIDGECVTIGKFKQCVLVIDHPIITELHARIYTICPDGHISTAYIRDHSENGTYINKRLIGRKRSAMLFSGCLIYFAHQEFRFYYISSNVLYRPDDPTILLQYIKRQHGPWNIVRLREQLHAGDPTIVFAATPYAIPNGTRAFQLACKRIKFRPHGISEGDISPRMRFEREVEILQNSRHPCIPFLVDYCRTEDPDPDRVVWFYHLFTPLAYGGTLRRLIECSPTLLEKGKVRFIVYQLLQGINYLHNLGNTPGKKSYIHADLKPENILIMEDTDRPYINITDFGHAVPIVDAEKEKDMLKTALAPDQGTSRYFSPERFAPEDFSGKALKAIDMWALGVIVYEMITCEYPFTLEFPHEDEAIKERICEEEVKFPQDCWKRSYDAKDREFVKKLLERDFKKRPSAAALLLDEFMLPRNDHTNVQRMARAWNRYNEDVELYTAKKPSKPYEPVDEALTRELCHARDFGLCIKFTPPHGGGRRKLNDTHYQEMVEMTAPDEEYRIRPLQFDNGVTLDPDLQLMEEEQQQQQQIDGAGSVRLLEEDDMIT